MDYDFITYAMDVVNMIRELIVWIDTKFGFSKKKLTLRPRKYGVKK